MKRTHRAHREEVIAIARSYIFKRVFSEPAFPFPQDRSRKRYTATINVPRMVDDVLGLAHAVNNGRRGDVA